MFWYGKLLSLALLLGFIAPFASANENLSEKPEHVECIQPSGGCYREGTDMNEFDGYDTYENLGIPFPRANDRINDRDNFVEQK